MTDPDKINVSSAQSKENKIDKESDQITQEPSIISFDPENGMKVDLWVGYFNKICQENNKTYLCKIKNIAKFLKGSALTHYINSCLNVDNFDDLCCILTEQFIQPNIVNFSDFSQLKFDSKNSKLVDYFHQKLNYGRQLGFVPQLILEGLTDGLPTQLKQLVSIKAPNTPTEWFTITTKLLKMEDSSEPNPGMCNETKIIIRQPAPFTPRHNFNYKFQNSFTSQAPNNFRQNYHNSIRPCPNNYNNYSHNLHFQQRLPSSPCRMCTEIDIPNVYHWTQACPFYQPYFMTNIPITANVTSPCTEVPLGCFQNSQRGPNSSNEAPSPAQLQLLVSGYISTLPSLANLDNVYNPYSNINIVIDTGSTLSIISADTVKKLNLTRKSVNPIRVKQAHGTFQLTHICDIYLKVGQINKKIKLYIMDNPLPYIILGLPDCSLYKLLIDCDKNKIFQNGQIITNLHTNYNYMSLHIVENNNTSDNKVKVVNTSEEIFPPPTVNKLSEPVLSLVSEYSHVFAKNKYDVGKIRMEPPRINLTSDLPVSQRSYRTSATDEIEINKQIKNLLDASLIKESTSNYSSPVTLAYKRDENRKSRLCIDYRKINSLCKSEAEPLPRIDTLLDKLSTAKVFSTLDLASGYWHIPLHEQDKHKLAFVTTVGLYEFQVLSFGFKNAPAIFDRTIRRILNKHKFSNFACHYFDDIVVFSNSLEEHYDHLKQIFQMCKKENIKLKFSKCVFAQDKINFLGYEVKEGCISPDNHNIESIKKLQPSKNVKQLQGFLGSLNVYNKFIDSYAKIREPLNNLLKKDTPWQ
ncbi:uncharacterized protein LOC129960966 [Argiope bruennichi]|uniref:uncharacterized protein LOC129960966 n=1 Tax=Argiope bruennichi TaxID=94029 RepID=UPI00249553E6|nr:uncharacterized protein LOC129960966 [Argiope bruennichi]